MSKTDKVDIEIYTHKVKSLSLNVDNQAANLAIFNMSLRVGEKQRTIDLAALDIEDGMLKKRVYIKARRL